MRIRYLILDIDGTMTDGKLHIGSDGETFKSFNVKDGCGIKDILPTLGIIPIVITGRESDIVSRRCDELGISLVFQGVLDKKDVLLNVLSGVSIDQDEGSRLKHTAYIGDDITDIECMRLIRLHGGVVGCPRDAVAEVRNIADFISKKNGGDGAVRDFIEYIAEEKK